MEAALQHVLHTSVGDYVTGLENTQGGFPLTLNNLRLKEKKIQEEMDESGECPFDFDSGSIGQITISPGWSGNVEIRATNIVVSMSFNAMKAMRNAMKPPEQEEYYETAVDRGVPPGVGAAMPRQVAPPPPVAPRFCPNHDSSDKRVKGAPEFKECLACGVRLQTSYTEFTLCPPCSDSKRRCMICGAQAEKGSSYIPPTTMTGPSNSARGDMPPPEPRRPGGGGCFGGGMGGRPHSKDLASLPPHLRALEEEKRGRAESGGFGGGSPTGGSRGRDMMGGMGGPPPEPPPARGMSDYGGHQQGYMPPSPGSHYGAGGMYGQGGCGGCGGPPPPPPPGGFNNGFGGPGGFPQQGPNGFGPPGMYGGQPTPPSNLGAGFDQFDISSAFKGIFDFNNWTQSCNVKSRPGGNQRIPTGGQQYGGPGMPAY